MLKIDLHLHTVASGHAYNTILEYINHAKKLKMKIIGISDHGPGSGELSEIYFKCLRRIPRFVDKVMILRGIEANIINEKGDIDISDKVIKRLDYVMANFHEETPYNNLGIEKNTAALIKTIKSGKIKIISHPFYNKAAPVDMRPVSEEACKKDVLLEITA
ncbi:MAG: PHP domain-containing protein [bacterium]